MTLIKIPKTPLKAFDKNRPASGLLRAQIEHLEAAVGIYSSSGPKKRRTYTEGEAAEYIRALTERITSPAPASESVAAPLPSPPPKMAQRPRKRRAVKKTKASKKSRRRTRGKR